MSNETFVDQVAEQTREDLRRAGRIPRMVSSHAVLQAGRLVECIICDISSGGAQLICIADVEPKTHVTVYLPGIGDAAAIVAWSSGVRMGVRFVDAIDPARLASPRR